MRRRGGTHEPDDVGNTVHLLLERGLRATREDRDLEALADYRACADLLRTADASQVPVSTARMAWMALAASERRRGSLDVALEAACRAVDLRAGLPVASVELFAGFYADLKELTQDLEKADRLADRVTAAELALAWSHALCEVDPVRFAATTAITGTALAKALGADGRPGDAVDRAAETLPVLGACRLGAIELSLRVPLGAWLRSLGRWEEAVVNEQAALALVRGRSARQAVVEVHVLLMLSRSLVGAGRPEEARHVLEEARGVVETPAPGVVPLSGAQLDQIRARVRNELASVDSQG
jgi:hypothetical protein